VLLAALAIAVSGAIGVYHAGVELGYWEGITLCTASGAKSLQDILSTPLVRCDQVQWELLGVSMAGWNAIISLGGAALITLLALRKRG
jgi:disulfide bond formation protein DsbB